ncbi:MAG: cyclic nucleotide-binding domain-containing protein [Candidatus Cloacimonetes bacterium]|nr:cyclic nucleotide-binding domain-containing protein [Candidatus Cloacimonadota bacterium]
MNIYVRTNDNDLLKYLSSQELDKVRTIEEKLELHPGQHLIMPDILTRDIYVITEGVVELWTPDCKQQPVVIAVRYEGELIGHLSYITKLPPVLTATAKGLVKAIKYSEEKLAQLMKNPNISAKIEAALNDSLAEQQIFYTQKLVALGDGGLDAIRENK